MNAARYQCQRCKLRWTHLWTLRTLCPRCKANASLQEFADPWGLNRVVVPNGCLLVNDEEEVIDL